MRLVLEHVDEDSLSNAAASAETAQERLGTETVRRWVLEGKAGREAK